MGITTAIFTYLYLNIHKQRRFRKLYKVRGRKNRGSCLQHFLIFIDTAYLISYQAWGKIKLIKAYCHSIYILTLDFRVKQSLVLLPLASGELLYKFLNAAITYVARLTILRFKFTKISGKCYKPIE